jgi:hypothetical protein
MKAKVTSEGVVIPKKYLEGIDEVEIKKENGFIIVIPIMDVDPIFGLGKNPVECGVTDALEQHDKDLY